MSGNELTNIQVYKKKWNINIGTIIFGIIFIYLLFTILAYVTARHITEYEVRPGSILRDTAYTGIIIRQEKVVASDAAGYINYFAAEGSKVGGKSDVYCISRRELQFDDESGAASGTDDGEETAKDISSSEQASVLSAVQTFSENFQEETFDDVYTLKKSIENVVSTTSAQVRKDQLSAMLKSGQSGIAAYPASEDGILLYSTDGYEDLKPEDVTQEIMSRHNYQRKDLTANAKVSAGDPVYKLVTGEEWSVVIELSANMSQELKDKDNVKVRFLKDNQTTWASLSISQRDGAYWGVLTFDHSMIRYVQERFLDIELILEDETGLKIPKTSVVKKDFYLLPEDYLIQNTETGENGIMVQGSGSDMMFRTADVYYRNNDTGMIYLDPASFEKGTAAVNPESSETYPLQEKESLPGVYNINKGFAVFRQVKILCESDEYYIVESGNEYGLSNYDHIALVGKNVREDDVVF